MFTLQGLLIVGGVLHLGLLIAAALLPFKLRWRSELMKLEPLSRHIIWTHGAFITLIIIGFALLSLTQSAELASGSSLGRSLCAFIAIFWAARLSLQFLLFDPRPYLTHIVLKIGERGLTVVFTYFTIVYTWAAIAPNARVGN